MQARYISRACRNFGIGPNCNLDWQDRTSVPLLISGFLMLLTGVVSIPVAVYCAEILLAVAFKRQNNSAPPYNHAPQHVAVLVPAHNESVGLLPTLADVRRQLRASDRLLVVADNCTDDTARAASRAGAEVIERNDPGRRGKGYALDFGIRHLSSIPPDILVIIDADCRLEASAIDRLARQCAASQRPVQALYLMSAPTESQTKHQVAEFAWRVKNWLRPLGLATLGLPCQLMGTGMALPWKVIRFSDLANGSIVEDLKLGLDLAYAGYPPLFCPSAVVTSQFASSTEGAAAQRSRWEQGFLHTISAEIPRLIRRAVVRRDWPLFALTLDLAVPPLSLLTLLVISVTFVTLLATLFFRLAYLPAVISATVLLALFIATLLAWLKCGREVLPGWTLLSIPYYMVGKLALYGQILLGKNVSTWVRTDRGKR
jgi:cellulose synthase/poly-beta-1,6-N-acetylglucosamine synthase-like glycosyltransferase